MVILFTDKGRKLDCAVLGKPTFTAPHVTDRGTQNIHLPKNKNRIPYEGEGYRINNKL